ncbi:MAG: hypothetical protein L0Y66_21415, partial [Myxococcaceae bacterium]|nr:hypothetical protein [Myxococcaceae bacterium]
SAGALSRCKEGEMDQLFSGPGGWPTWSPAYRTLVVWTLPGKDFVCVEPWTAPAGALRSGEGLRHVAPGERTVLSFQAEALAPA